MGGTRDVRTDQGLTYAVDPADFALKRLFGSRAATPGAVDADQVPTELTTPVANAAAPTIEDTTPETIDQASDFTASARITDNVQVRSVTLQLRSDLDEAFTDHHPLVGEGDTYAHTVQAVDLTGKAYYEYRFVVSDGTHEIGCASRLGCQRRPARLSVVDGDVHSGTMTASAEGTD